MSLSLRLSAAGALILVLIAAGQLVELDAKVEVSAAYGLALGVILQRSRFCFFCHARDFIETRDARGVVAILAALAAGTIGYYIIFHAWLPNPQQGRLPPGAHIGPVSLALVSASAAFGIGMAVSGSCVSGHLYRLGEGSPTAPFALLGTVLGFVAGFAFQTSITDSYATGAVSGGRIVGGLTGFLSSSSITNSYAAGTVTAGSDVGGLVGGWGIPTRLRTRSMTRT